MKKINEGIFGNNQEKNNNYQLSVAGNNACGEFGLIYNYAQEAIQSIYDMNTAQALRYLTEILKVSEHYANKIAKMTNFNGDDFLGQCGFRNKQTTDEFGKERYAIKESELRQIIKEYLEEEYLNENRFGKLGKFAVGAATALSTLGGMNSCQYNEPSFNGHPEYGQPTEHAVKTQEQLKQEKLQQHANDTYTQEDGYVGFCYWQGRRCAKTGNSYLVDVIMRDGRTGRFILPEDMFYRCTDGKRPTECYLPNSQVATDVIKHLEELEPFDGEVSYFAQTGTDMMNERVKKTIKESELRKIIKESITHYLNEEYRLAYRGTTPPGGPDPDEYEYRYDNYEIDMAVQDALKIYREKLYCQDEANHIASILKPNDLIQKINIKFSVNSENDKEPEEIEFSDETKRLFRVYPELAEAFGISDKYPLETEYLLPYAVNIGEGWV